MIWCLVITVIMFNSSGAQGRTYDIAEYTSKQECMEDIKINVDRYRKYYRNGTIFGSCIVR